ncbi:MAG: type II and III secretion system protein [candidate division KSB1 bacterium]|jgi:type IV pilus assembly protein PilQ|nr:type II and III secretion system protein [candidate division KSB1 bacterium]
MKLSIYLKITVLAVWIIHPSLVLSVPGQQNDISPAQRDSVLIKQNNRTASVDSLPPGAYQAIENLDFKDSDIRDVVRSIAHKYKLNIFIADDVRNRITMHLSDISVYQALEFIVNENGLQIEQRGHIFKITNPPDPEPIPPPPPDVAFTDGLLSVDLDNDDLHRVVHEISKKAGVNIVVNQGVHGRLSGYIQNIKLIPGLKYLLEANGFDLRTKNDILWIDADSRHHSRPEASSTSYRSRYWFEVNDSLISLEVVDAELKQLIGDVAAEIGIDMVFYGEIKGKVSAKCTNIRLEELLLYLFKGTEYTYRKEKNIYLIGDKKVRGITHSKLIRLNHMKVEGITELLPANITSAASLKIVKEHNALMVIGSHDLIEETENYLHQIDHPIPQILIEAIVVDYNTTDISEFRLEAGTRTQEDSSRMDFSFFPHIEVDANAGYLQNQLELYGPQLGLVQIGKLPTNFYMRLKMMETEGRANVRSRPQIATLNGHTASISIGTTQYFILKSQTPYSNPNQIILQESERFEKISAEMLLEITPWVSASGEITVEIHPEFSTPRGNLDATRPPTIDHRILDSTVRLRDGETIILGGLRQTIDNVTISKFPVLGDIPLLGRLFQNRQKNKTEAELVIYVTPHLNHIYDGSIR